MFNKLDHPCPYRVCNLRKGEHTLDLLEQHKQLARISNPNCKYSTLKGIGIGAIIMAWLVISISAVIYFVIGK